VLSRSLSDIEGGALWFARRYQTTALHCPRRDSLFRRAPAKGVSGGLRAGEAMSATLK